MWGSDTLVVLHTYMVVCTRRVYPLSPDYTNTSLLEGNRGLSNYLQQGRWIPAFQLSFRCQMLFIIFKVQMISTQQVVQFHCLQIIRIYKQTINRSHGFHGRSPIFFLQCTFISFTQQSREVVESLKIVSSLNLEIEFKFNKK